MMPMRLPFQAYSPSVLSYALPQIQAPLTPSSMNAALDDSPSASDSATTSYCGSKKRGRCPACKRGGRIIQAAPTLVGLCVALLLPSIAVDAFQCVVPSAAAPELRTTTILLSKKRAGSFFNPVPDDDNDDSSKNKSREMADKLREVLKDQQRQPPNGFGKPPQPQASLQRDATTNKPYIGIGTPPPPRRNDVTKPEYDADGYTLYADEQTGERSRVFEALVEYPCDFTLKIVGAQDATFVSDMVAIVARTCQAETSAIEHSTKHNGKWTSVTVQAPVQNAEMLYELYANIDEDPRVKFKF